MMRRLMPQDARVGEIASAFALLVLGVSLLLGANLAGGLLAVHPAPFWMVVASVLGGLQLLSLVFYGKLELLRCAVSMVCGSLWVWLGLMGIDRHVEATDFSAILLGLANLYAFSLNSLILKAAWKS